jgi:ABC-type multidrug transport system ATPase subunit
MDNGKIVNSGTTKHLISKYIYSYSILANNIESSEVLRKYQTVFGVNEVKVVCNSGEITGLLNELLSEGVQVTACIPDLTLEQLIKGTL